ncbi:hypothetical protein FHT28_006949 [Rhizobium sp. SG570]|nr:hypothetical protein [Rhizobium sp. SG570]
MSEGCEALSRYHTFQQWMSFADRADEAILEEGLNPKFRQRLAGHADLQVCPPRAQRHIIAFRLLRKAQSYPRSCLCDSSDQGNAEGLYEAVICMNGERCLQPRQIKIAFCVDDRLRIFSKQP